MNNVIYGDINFKVKVEPIIWFSFSFLDLLLLFSFQWGPLASTVALNFEISQSKLVP